MILWIMLAILLVLFVYWKGVRPMSYWKRKGVNQGSPVWFLGDNLDTLLRKRSFIEIFSDLYNLHPNTRYVGAYQFHSPALMIKDPDLIRQIAVKDFDHFVDHKEIIPETVDPLWSNNLAALTGEKWRHMRATLSPAFTSSKMKSMLVFMEKCGERFANHFIEKTVDGNEITVDIKDAFTRYTNDVIASTAFGIKCNSLKDQNNEFFLLGKEATNFKGFWKNMNFMICMMLPSLARIFKLSIFSKQLRIFFTRIVKETITVRETQGIVRPDMIHLLMEAKKGRLKHDENNVNKNDTQFSAVHESEVVKTDLDITAQALIFFFAGFETVSTLLAFVTYELAINPDIQEKLYKEIVSIGEKITYEGIMSMKYLDMVVTETLRKWPPAIATDRKCVKPYTIQPQNPNEKPVHLDVNDIVWFPFYALHHDEKYYPQPEKYDPERFNDENKQNIVPYTYLPFGVGPRNCIGSRFALLETKIALYSLLSKFEITVVDKTDIPLKLDKTQFNPVPKNGFWVGLKPRQES